MVGTTVQQVPELSILIAEGDGKRSKGMNNVIMGGTFKRESREEKEETISLLSSTERARRKELEHCFHGKEKIEDNRERGFSILAEEEAGDCKAVERNLILDLG